MILSSTLPIPETRHKQNTVSLQPHKLTNSDSTRKNLVTETVTVQNSFKIHIVVTASILARSLKSGSWYCKTLTCMNIE